MKNQIGLLSNSYNSTNEFNINFELFKQYGVSCLDYQELMSTGSRLHLYNLSDEEFESHFKKLKKQLDKHGLIVNQLHSLWDPDFEYTHSQEEVFKCYQKAIVAAGILHAKYVVYHRIPLKGHYLWDKVDYQELYDLNLDFVRRLLPLAKRNDVYIAIENLPFFEPKDFFSPNGTLTFINELNDDHVVMCLDTGHFNMFREEKIYEFLLKGKDKVKCLHIHDNNGYSDAHQVPHLGSFDWESFLKGLKAINFEGILSSETKIPATGLSKKAFELLNDGLITILKDMQEYLAH